MEALKNYLGKKEFRMLAVAALGQGMIYGIMSSYISDFYLNILKVGPIFVLLLMLLARVWDAVNDPMMGMIADRVNMKRGKMKPYLLFTPIPVAVLTFLLFFAPDISDTGKMVYAAVTYTLWGMVYTSSDVPFWSLPNIMTPNPSERGRVFSICRTTNGIGSATPMAIFMALGFILPATGLSGLQLEKTKYLTIALIASVIGNFLFANAYFHVRERVNIPREKRKPGEPGSLKLLFTCKPLMLVLIMGVLSSGRYMLQAGAIHVSRYSFYIGPNLEIITDPQAREAALQSSISLVNTIFAAATAVGMFGTMLLIPLLIKRFNYKQLIIASCVIGFFSGIAIFLIGYEHFWACVPFFVLSCIPAGTINVLSSALIGDSLDYMELKTGRRETGLGSACQSFVNKLGNAVATSSIVLMYIVVKLDVSKIGTQFTMDPATLDPSVRSGMFLVVSLIPAVSMIVCMIPMFFYKLVGKQRDRVTEELRQRREDMGIVFEK